MDATFLSMAEYSSLYALCVLHYSCIPQYLAKSGWLVNPRVAGKPRCLNRFACCIKYQLWNHQMACALFRSVRERIWRERMDERGSIMSTPSVVLDELEFDFDFDFLDEVQGLSEWELLNSSDADSEYHLGEERAGHEALDTLRNGDLPVMFVPATLEEIGNSRNGVSLENYDHYLHATNDEYDDEDDDSDDGDKHDLDDELIPWSVSSKFHRQRMRKLGKRAFPKMLNSKKPPYLFMRPGCVRGKHGLGLKHN